MSSSFLRDTQGFLALFCLLQQCFSGFDEDSHMYLSVINELASYFIYQMNPSRNFSLNAHNALVRKHCLHLFSEVSY